METTVKRNKKKVPTNAELEMKSFRKNMDSWVKFFNGKIQVISGVNTLLRENSENSNHNYELIREIKEDMEELKAEMKTMKLMQMMILEREAKNREELRIQ